MATKKTSKTSAKKTAKAAPGARSFTVDAAKLNKIAGGVTRAGGSQPGPSGRVVVN